MKKKIIGMSIGILCGALCAKGAFVIAHRGESKERPQNTLAAFDLAWKNGVSHVEADFHSTKSGKIVCVHMPKEFKQFYGCEKKIEELSAEDAQNLKFSSDKWPEYKGAKIPLLEDVMRIIPKAGGVLVLEIKGMDENFLKLVDEERVKNGLPKSALIFIAFDFKHACAVKKFDKEYKSVWLYDINKVGIDGEYAPEAVIKKVKDAGLDGVDVGGVGKLTRDYVKAFKDAGLDFYVWTVDSDREAKRMIEFGVDGVTTNRASSMKENLKFLLNK